MTAPLVPLAEREAEPVVEIGRLVDWLAAPVNRSVPPASVIAEPWPRLLAAPPTSLTVPNSRNPSATATLPVNVLAAVRRTMPLVCAQPPRSSLIVRVRAPPVSPTTPEMFRMRPAPFDAETLALPANVTVPARLRRAS